MAWEWKFPNTGQGCVRPELAAGSYGACAQNHNNVSRYGAEDEEAGIRGVRLENCQ